MQIKDLVKENETVVAQGRVYRSCGLNECGNLIVTDRRILTQFGKNICITKMSAVKEIYSSDEEKHCEVFILLDGGETGGWVELYFANNADWRAWRDEVFEALSKYAT